MIQRAITRRAQNTLADALFERFLIWVLAGDAIATEVERAHWDSSNWPTIEQFGIVMSFFELMGMNFEADANVVMINWCNEMKIKGI
jgi:hypothetical protein